MGASVKTTATGVVDHGRGDRRFQTYPTASSLLWTGESSVVVSTRLSDRHRSHGLFSSISSPSNSVSMSFHSHLPALKLPAAVDATRGTWPSEGSTVSMCLCIMVYTSLKGNRLSRKQSNEDGSQDSTCCTVVRSSSRRREQMHTLLLTSNLVVMVCARVIIVREEKHEGNDSVWADHWPPGYMFRRSKMPRDGGSANAARYFGSKARRASTDGHIARVHLWRGEKRRDQALLWADEAERAVDSKPVGTVDAAGTSGYTRNAGGRRRRESPDFLPIDPTVMSPDEDDGHSAPDADEPGKDDGKVFVDSLEQRVVRRTKEFNRRTRERPKSEQVWLQFADFQDEAVRAIHGDGELRMTYRGHFCDTFNCTLVVARVEVVQLFDCCLLRLET